MYLTIAVYFVIMIAVGLLSRRSSRTISDFTVGTRSATAWLSAFSYGTAYFSAVMFIGYAGGTGWKYGLWGVLPGLGNAVFGSLLAWMVLANRTREVTRRLEIRSMPQLFEKRFGSDAMKQFCVFVTFIFLVPYSATVYKGLSSVCAVLLNVDERLCMVIIALAAAVLVIFGGYVATLKADFLQGFVMIFGVLALIVVVFRSQQVGGLTAGLTAISAETASLNLTAKDHIGLWATVLMTSFGTWGLPQMIHKYYGIKDKTEVKRGVVISTLFALIIAGGGYLIGSLSHLFFTELPEKGTDYLVPYMLDHADDGLSAGQAVQADGAGEGRTAGQSRRGGLHRRFLPDREHRNADSGYDVLLVGRDLGVVYGAVPDQPVLEKAQPRGRLGGNAGRLSHRLPAGRLQAVLPRRVDRVR